ncbi:MAG TPA: STAS domain-containing protein [Acidimicrobiales bacterium]|nr:STAS domain-containing protein [Acidimicrobiales bacterium]
MTASEGIPAFAADTNVDGARIMMVLRGEIDAYTAPRLEDAVSALGDVAGRHLVVDLSGVGFVDSTGLSALVGSLGRVRTAGGVVSLREVPRQLAKLFEITGISRLFPLE